MVVVGVLRITQKKIYVLNSMIIREFKNEIIVIAKNKILFGGSKKRDQDPNKQHGVFFEKQIFCSYPKCVVE